MEKIVIGMMFVIIMMVVMTQVVQAMVPQKNQCCPICGECFYTYDELYNHFVGAHPAIDIEVIWD